MAILFDNKHTYVFTEYLYKYIYIYTIYKNICIYTNIQLRAASMLITNTYMEFSDFRLRTHTDLFMTTV